MERKEIEKFIEVNLENHNSSVSELDEIHIVSKKDWQFWIDTIQTYAQHREQLAVRTALKDVHKCLKKHGINSKAPILNIVLSLEQEIISKLKNEKG